MNEESERRILQVLPRLVTGGVERGTIEMATAIRAAGWRAFVASEGGPMVAELEKIGVTHITLPLASKNPNTMMKNIDSLADVINEHNIDLVHARSRAPAWSAFFAARQTGTHFVTTFHNAYGEKSQLKRFYNSVMARGEVVIAISNYVAAYAKATYKIPPEKFHVIPRGVDIYRFDPKRVEKTRIVALREKWGLAEDQFLVLLPGRLTRWKGQFVFIEAVARLKRPDITFLIVGTGDADYRRELEATITRLKLAPHMRVVNECDDMPAAFSLAQIVISASTRPEGFGRVIVEAQAMGCAVIATRHGGAEETILDGKTGWLVTPGNGKVLAKAMEKILSMPPETLKKIGAQAQTHVRAHFTTELMTSRTIKVYRDLLETEQPEPAPPFVQIIKDWFKKKFAKSAPPAPAEDGDSSVS